MFKKTIFSILLIFLILLVSFNVMAEEVTLKFMGWEASPLETESVKQGLEEFMKQNPNIKVEYTPVAGDYRAKLLTMMAGNAAPDVFFIAADYYNSFQERGVLYDLTEYFNQSMNIEEFIPLTREKMLLDGKIYGISSCNVSPVLFYNKNIFDEAGLAYPPSDPDKAWSWDKFVDIAQQLTIENNGRVQQYGAYGFRVDWGWIFPVMVHSNGGRVFNDDYTELLLDSPEAKEALIEIKNLQTTYGAAPQAAVLEQSGMNAAQMLQTGRVAMLAEGSWALQQLSDMNFPVGIGVLPKFNKPSTVGQAHLHSVWSKTDYPDEAWKLVKFLSSQKYQNKLINSGLWLPNRMDMYKEENFDTWMNPEVYPEDFENIVKYFTEYGELWPAVKAPSEAWDIINEELDNFFQGDEDIDNVIARMKERVDPLLVK